jgi:hypothetical protein
MEQAEQAGTALCFVVIWPGTIPTHPSQHINHILSEMW